jgi:4-carboxymuconolactone decarboxylase
MNDRDKGIAQIREMIPASVWNVDDGRPEGSFAAELSDLAVTNVFGRLWAREGLDRRARSLLTLGILIALRAAGELRIHFLIARANGLTREEIEEVIYHSTGYAGFPAATEAAKIATEVFDHAE